MSSLPLRCSLGLLLTGSMLLAPAGALGAISAAPLKPCYVSVAEGRTEPIDVIAAGFDAGATVDIQIDGDATATVQAAGNGRIAVRVPAPHKRRGERGFSLALAQRDRPDARLELRSRVTALNVRLRPLGAEPRAVIGWAGRGFTAPGPVFAHYVRDGQPQRTQRLGVPRGRCGSFHVRRRQFPFSPSTGPWTIQVDQQRRFAPTPDSPFVRMPVSVRRVSDGS